MKEKENINKFTAKYGKELPYSVPDGYFDSLPFRIQEYCLTQSPVHTKQKVTVWQAIRAQISLAAGFVALAFLAAGAYYVLQPTSNTPSVLSNDDYIEIIQNNIYDFDEENLINEIQPYRLDDSIQSYNDEMIQYLLDQDIDYTTLIEQY
ncbi:MAG: hypothetical protein PHE03_05395 [Bacteroidales bacterium]|nr:hypothetical protein [Bacteroidales bacterium]